MMKQEFERIAGYEVSVSDYDNIIEPMYMALNVDKRDFVKMVSKKRFALKPPAKIVKEIKEIMEHLRESCTHYTDIEAEDRMCGLIREYIERRGWTGYAGFIINTGERFTCSYPRKIEIFETKHYSNLAEIKID